MSIGGFQKNIFDQVGDELGIGLGRELVTFLDKLSLQRDVVFDNAVVNDDDFSSAVAMRVGIFFGRTAVRSPTSVADAVGAIERFEADHLFQFRSLPSARRICKPSPLPHTAIPAES